MCMLPVGYDVYATCVYARLWWFLRPERIACRKGYRIPSLQDIAPTVFDTEDRYFVYKRECDVFHLGQYQIS